MEKDYINIILPKFQTFKELRLFSIPNVIRTCFRMLPPPRGSIEVQEDSVRGLGLREWNRNGAR